MQDPQGNPFFVTPLQLAQPLLNPGEDPPWLQSPPAVSFLGWLCPEHVCLLFLHGCPSLPVLGRFFFFIIFFFHWVFVSFENTLCLCCSFSAAQCTSPFPRPGARSGVRSRQSRVAGVAGHPRASGTDKVSSAANVSRGNGTLKAHPLETIYKALSPL